MLKYYFRCYTVLCSISSKGNWMILHVSPLIAGWRLESDSKKILLYFFLFLFCTIILRSRHCHQNETSSTALTLKAKYFITVNSFTFMQHTFHISLSTNVHPAIWFLALGRSSKNSFSLLPILLPFSLIWVLPFLVTQLLLSITL